MNTQNLGRWAKITWSLLGIIVFIAVWWIAALQLGSARMASPWEVAKVFLSILFQSRALTDFSVFGTTGIIPHLLASLFKLIIGSAIGIVLGISIGFLMSASNTVFGFFNLPIRALNAIPPLAFVPFILVWFGTGPVAQVILVTVYVFVILLTTTIEAVRHVKPAYLGFAASLGAKRKNIYKNVIFPSSLPEIFASIRVAIAFAWGLVIVAEFVGGQVGIGRVVSYMMPLLLIDQLIAVIIWIAVLAVFVDWVIIKLGQHFLKWNNN
jgi:ABC-type nitrate/sulfonate/bicarbonate transport system permease component